MPTHLYSPVQNPADLDIGTATDHNDFKQGLRVAVTTRPTEAADTLPERIADALVLALHHEKCTESSWGLFQTVCVQSGWVNPPANNPHQDDLAHITFRKASSRQTGRRIAAAYVAAQKALRTVLADVISIDDDVSDKVTMTRQEAELLLVANRYQKEIVEVLLGLPGYDPDTKAHFKNLFDELSSPEKRPELIARLKHYLPIIIGRFRKSVALETEKLGTHFSDETVNLVAPIVSADTCEQIATIPRPQKSDVQGLTIFHRLAENLYVRANNPTPQGGMSISPMKYAAITGVGARQFIQEYGCWSFPGDTPNLTLDTTDIARSPDLIARISNVRSIFVSAMAHAIQSVFGVDELLSLTAEEQLQIYRAFFKPQDEVNEINASVEKEIQRMRKWLPSGVDMGDMYREEHCMVRVHKAVDVLVGEANLIPGQSSQVPRALFAKHFDFLFERAHKVRGEIMAKRGPAVQLQRRLAIVA